ncbi:interferon-induced very large GTPase 1-like [Ostrea edulis]|uniref:interferon-induced very large GTPase 1-like n=1 Tax=Ostrea edulis TaxID=37623 RepID=UPI0024AEA9C6|nr:interferon-induced very large GTPase 1-like [Ostrea edulis]XP_048748974.2 interferon-induced very large GTPase 1-like [Ostrea edulis]
MAAKPTHGDHKCIQSSSESVEMNIASQNVCLRGVYVSNDVMDIERCRGRVLESKTAVLFPLKNIIERNEIIDFGNEERANKFLHVLINFGYSAALQNHKSDLEKNPLGNLPTFYRRTSFCVVNVREWTPRVCDLSLSRLAIQFLKDIEIKLSSENNGDHIVAQEDCISFFKMFGTHVYMTSINFGGIFTVSSSTALLENDNVLSTKQQIKQVHNNAIINHLFSDSKSESTEIKENGRDEYVLKKNKIETKQRHFGGPKETYDFTVWKAELLKNPETWTVSDMGEISFDNCVGIWSFVKKHQSCFTNAEQLSSFLAKAWQDHVAQRNISNLVSDSFWKTFVKDLDSILSVPCSASCHLGSLKEILQLLEKHVILVGKGVTKVLDIFSATSVQRLFKDSAKHKTPINICFQILTTKLKILQIDNGKSSAFGSSWIASDYFIPGLLSRRELNNVEELLDLLESELLPGIDALESYNDINLGKVQSLAKSELLNTVQNFLQILLGRQEYQEALLLLVLFLSIGYHFKRENVQANITSEILVTFTASAKRELALARKYKEDETREAWLLLEIIFKLDTNYRIFDAPTVLVNEVNDFVGFLKEKGFVFHSNIEKVIYSEQGEPHGIIHSLAEICKLSCDLFGEETMRTLHSTNTEYCPSSTNFDALYRIINTFGMEHFFPQKLSTGDVLKLSDALFACPRTMKDIPWAIFRQAIAIDYNFRENVLSDFSKKLRTRNQAISKKENKQSAKKVSMKHNPMDVFLALWHCCDPFLKKILAAKIATCQLALPLIYEDITTRQQLTISLWPIRDVFIDDSPDSVLTKPLKSVSFVRVGDLKSISKSKIINKFLRGQNNEHSTFYHRDCTLASNKRLVSNGIVEITWYVPRKDNDDVNSDIEDVNSTETEELLEEIMEPVCILNMRGDAKDFESQLLALLALSDVVVVMSEFEYLNDDRSLQVLKQIHNSSAFAIIMTDFPESVEQQEMDNSDEDEDNEITDRQDQEEKTEESDVDRDNSNKVEKEQEQEESNRMGEEERISMSLEELCGENLPCVYETKTGLNPMNTSFLSTLDRGKTLNESDLKDCLTTQIMSALKNIEFAQSLERKKMLLPAFVAIDEDNTYSKYGSDLSETVFGDVEYSANTMHRKQIKDKILPLQGENLWHTWCLEQKQCFRSGKKSVSDNVHHKKKMKTLRLWQVMSCLENGSTIVKFVDVLERHIDDRLTITYFLQWMKFHMDCQSRQIIPKLSNDLFEAFRQYETLRSQSDTEREKVENLKSQIKSAEENLANASFGLEHFFREMGQLYESFFHCDTALQIRVSTNTKRIIDKIPHIAAKLLYWGHSLEIMDGDAASVPESWIKAVFKEIRSIIGEKKTLYVISVLGIQSSGKSTLLNTMFGLQFSVSAGRCTRGIYAQLIPVDKSQSSLKFDYALVIDTEGLRAPELAGEKYNHDNELATLVIGLADVALINIKGETIADMQDVLQIVVHALIRLKNANEELNIKQSCVFVHQNVSASNAGKSTFQGSQKVTSVLDEMTKHIAEQEKMANITRFTDVIAFNPVTNVIHVPDLWQGVPPMAPASPEYSKKVFQVAKCILGDICKNKKSFLNSEDTSIHLGNLWKGIISEDFVFSFRNALEVKAFTMLEIKFQSFVWTLQELKLQYLQNTLIQICCSKTHEILQNTITNIKERFHKNLQEKTALCDKELQSFFDKSDLSDYMIHWRARKTEELQAISRNIRIEIHTKIESEKGKCEALFNSNKKLASVKENVTSKAVEFAKSENNKEHTWNEEDVKKQFERLWEEWLGELAPEVSEDAIQRKIAEMKLQVINEVQNKFSSHQPVYTKVSNSTRLPLQKRMTKLIGCIREEDIDEKDIEVIGIKEKVKRLFGKFLPESIKDYLQIHKHYFEKTKNMIDTIFSDIEKYMQTQNENVEYNSAQFIQVLNYITDGFRNHNDKSNVHTFMVTVRLEAKTAIMVERYAVNEFTQHIRRYEIQNSLRSKMTKYKKEVESLFLGMYFETANEELATSIICDHIENALRQRLSQELHKQMWSQVTHSEFGNRKEPLIKAVLTDLAQRHQFRDYVVYINNSKSYVSSWIEKYTKTLFEKKNNNGVSEFQQCIARSLETACVTIQKCAVGAEAEGKKQSCNSESEEETDVSPSLQQLACWGRWINAFRDRLVRENFQMPPDCFQTLFHLKVEKIDNLIKNIERNLDVRRNSLYDTFKNMPLSNMSWGDNDPFKEIMETLWGCDKNCPWCLEPCVVSSTNDRHACKQHRPEGIAGVRWEHTTKLVCESCDFSVQSDSRRRCGSWCKCDPKTDGHHPCKEYKTHMKEAWDISGSSDMSSSKYWIWVFKEFEKDFVKYHNAKSPDFPNSDAFKITKDEAINSLSVYE